MRIHTRIHRLEREAAGHPVPATTRKDALAWSARFRGHDPANAALWNEIRGWGAEHRRDYIYAERGDDITAGEMMKALYHPVRHAACNERWIADRAGFGDAPGLLRRFADAAFAYQQDTGDGYPAAEYDLPLVDKLAGDRGRSFRAYVLLLCDLAEKRLLDPRHPDVLAFQQRLAALMAA